MILAAPLVIPFAEIIGVSIAALGMAKATDEVNKYIESNPEKSAMILKTLVPNLGIGEIFMNKEKISLEDLDEMTDEEAQDLSKEEKAELMKQGGKSKSKDKRQTMIDLSEKLGLSGEGKEKQDIEYEVDERYDEGGVEDAPKPKFDYKKFFKKRYADGGAIGIEVLFEEKKPRKNFFMGGPALTGQALNIYNSMNSYGFTDQQIADALRAQGLYGATPAAETPVTNTAPNIINQGGGDGPPNDPPKDPFGGLGYSSANFGLGANKDVMDYEADAYNVGRTLTGQLNKIGLGIFSALKNIPTPFNLARKAFENYKEQKAIEEAQKEAARLDAERATLDAAYGSGNKGADFTGGRYDGADSFSDYSADPTGYSGSSKDGGIMGYGGKSGTPRYAQFKKGGLATMFTRKR